MDPHHYRGRFRRDVFYVGRVHWYPVLATAPSTTASSTTVPTISGSARVIDGDTVVVGGTRVRLKGVDAAELGTARGENARRAIIAQQPRSSYCVKRF